MHVVRCFEDPDVTHVMGAIDPVRDREVIEFELALADLAALEKRLDKTRRSARTGDKEAQIELPVLEKADSFLKDGKGLWEARLTTAENAILAPLTLLTTKPVLYAANVTDTELAGDEGPHLRALRDAVRKSGEQADVVPFSAKIEAELSDAVNELGIGPQGLGGRSTAFRVHVEVAATHITMNPVAVNIQCHSARRANAVITPGGIDFK